MSARPFMPLWAADFLADTEHLSAAETGSYICLILHLWLRGKLHDDDRRLARIARCSPRQWRAMRPTLEPLFVSKDHFWEHKRVSAEQVRVADLAQKRAAAVANRPDRDPTFVPTNGLQNPGILNSDLVREESKSSDAGASAVPAQPPAPVYTDSKHELWGEGVPILISLGLSEGRARQMIGTWRKQAHEDAQAVLSAIQRARDHRIADPIPWITAALKPHQENNHARPREKPTIMESAALIAAHIEAGGSVDPTTWIDVPRPQGPPPVRSGAGNGVAQLLPPKRH